MKKLAFFGLLACMSLLSSSCISKALHKSMDVATGPLICTPIALAQILVESTVSICEKDSLEFGTPVYINRLDVRFNGTEASFKAQLDSLEATLTSDSTMRFRKVVVVGDSIHYNENYAIPFHNFHLGNDSIQLMVQCEYLPNMNVIGNNRFKYLKSEYIMKDREIIQHGTHDEEPPGN